MTALDCPIALALKHDSEKMYSSEEKSIDIARSHS